MEWNTNEQVVIKNLKEGEKIYEAAGCYVAIKIKIMIIRNIPISNRCTITVFKGRSDYSLSKHGEILYDRGNSYVTEFLNARARFNSHKLYNYTKLNEKIIAQLFTDAKIEPTDFDSFLATNAPEILPLDNTVWLILPYTTKNLIGKPFDMDFSVGTKDFGHGNEIMTLPVYMTQITKASKSVKFSLEIPASLYDKCMENPVAEDRPTKRYIEAETISTLHNEMSKLVSLAHRISEIEKEAKKAKKIIVINFNSTEHTTRDGYNHAYTGQAISTHFNFFVAYECKTGIFTFKKYQTGQGSTEKGIKGIIDTENIGGRQWIKMTNTKVIVDWTQEKEDFLIKLEDDFRKLSNRLNNFLQDLDEDKLMGLINNSTQKLLN